MPHHRLNRLFFVSLMASLLVTGAARATQDDKSNFMSLSGTEAPAPAAAPTNPQAVPMIKPHVILKYTLFSTATATKTNIVGEVTSNFGETAISRYSTIQRDQVARAPGVTQSKIKATGATGWTLSFTTKSKANGDITLHGNASYSDFVTDANSSDIHLRTVTHGFDAVLHADEANVIQLPWADTTLTVGVAPASDFVPDEKL